MNLTEVKFKIIDERLAKAVVIQKHYLHRPPPISFAYGAYIEGDRKTKGVLTVGKPCSPTVCEGVCGKDRAKDVFELNRLWMDDALPETVTDSTGKVHSAGYESRFIGWCLRELRGSYPNLILVSYADTRQRHVGTVIRRPTGLIREHPHPSKTRWASDPSSGAPSTDTSGSRIQQTECR